MDIKKVNVQSKLNAFNDYWNPKIIGELNQQLVKVAKFKGDFVRHQHENEDELFFVMRGQLFIELSDQTIVLNAGEFVIIPKGEVHKPFAPEEVHVLLFEPDSTVNTGDTINNLTVAELKKI